MILSDVDLKEAIANKEIEISGISPLYIGPSSVDLHLDNKAKIMPTGTQYNEAIDISDGESIKKLFVDYNGWDSITISPRELYILSTVEKITLPNNIVAFLQGRSSIARVGLQVHAAGFFDPNFSGTATLEVSNLTNHPIKIPKHTRICQMVFMQTKSPAEIGYDKKSDSKYQNQSGPKLTEIYRDYEQKD